MPETKRKFYLEDAGPDSVLGLSRFTGKLGKGGLIPIADLDVSQMDELERMAATPGHPVIESEPEATK